MNKEELQQAIREVISRADGSCNGFYLAHVDGLLRGLLWALTGTDHGTYLSKNVPALLIKAGIEFRQEGDRVIFL